MAHGTTHPHAVIDAVLGKYKIESDAALARTLKIAPTAISRVRSGTVPLGASMVLRLHETLGMPVKEIRKLEAA